MIVDQLSIISPKITLEKNAEGQMNYQRPKAPKQAGKAAGKKGNEIGLGQIKAMTVSDGMMIYSDRTSGQTMRLEGLNIQLSETVWKQISKAGKIFSHFSERT